MRHLLLYNASIQKKRADYLWAGIVIFTLLATISPIVYLFMELTQPSYYVNSSGSDTLVKLNLLLPLVATVLRGTFAALNPLTKWGALKLAATQVEGQIYMYRTKVGRYSIIRHTKATSATDTSKKDKKDKKDDTNADQLAGGSPRKAFSFALDSIWLDLSASDIQKGALITPPAR